MGRWKSVPGAYLERTTGVRDGELNYSSAIVPPPLPPPKKDKTTTTVESASWRICHDGVRQPRIVHTQASTASAPKGAHPNTHCSSTGAAVHAGLQRHVTFTEQLGRQQGCCRFCKLITTISKPTHSVCRDFFTRRTSRFLNRWQHSNGLACV